MRDGTDNMKANPTHQGAIFFLIIATPAIIQTNIKHQLYISSPDNQTKEATDSSPSFIAFGSIPEATNPAAKARKPEIKAIKAVPKTPRTVTTIPVLGDRTAILCPMKMKVATKKGTPIVIIRPSYELTQLRSPGSVPIPNALTIDAIKKHNGAIKASIGNRFLKVLTHLSFCFSILF